MAAAARATLIGRDDAHFRDLLARLPAHLVAPPDLDEAAAEKFYKNKGQKAPEAERRAASKQRRAEARAQRDAKRRGAGAAPAADFDGLGDAEDDAAPAVERTGEAMADVRQRLQARIAGLKGTRGTGEKKKTKKKRKETATADARPAKHARKEVEEDTKVGALRDAREEVKTPKLVQGAPGSKTRKLKGLLKQAERDAAEVRHLRASGQDAAADDRQWDEALRVASGERAAVDPAKVKKALKLREKKKKKSAKEWAARGRASARAVAAKKVPSGKRVYDD